MKPYSNDLRRRIVEAIQENEETQADIAGRFAVSISFVEKLWQRFRTTGSYAALPRGGGQRRALAGDAFLIREAIKEQPDLTLAELCRRVAAASGSEPVSAMTMCNELHRLRLPRKKR